MRAIIVKLLGWVERTLDPTLVKIASALPGGPQMYYLIHRAYWREHRATLAARLEQINGGSKGDAAPGRFRLRRNTHRLEKGLIMRPRRSVFARAYLPETVDLYCDSVRGGSSEASIVDLNRWAGDVLASYFEAVAAGQDETIDAARERFERANESCDWSKGESAPYHRDTSALGIDIEAMQQLAHRRRSVRWYKQERVDRSAIDRAIEVASQAPSACNRQPFEFHIFDDPEDARRIGKIPMGTAGFSQNFPCLIVVVGDLIAYPRERDRHVIYIDAALASMSLLFALETQGIASCCINWPDIPGRERLMARELGLSATQRVVMCISVGYPDEEGMVPFSQKKPLDEIRMYRQAGGGK